jgi:tRNA 2-thiocytidine biosynthesis protein TtcA
MTGVWLMNNTLQKLRIKLNRKMLKTSKEYGLLQAGDKVMVAISGGKDSYTLLDLLWRARQRVPFHFDVVAVHLDQQQPGYDGVPLAQWLENYGAPYKIVSKDTYSIVKSVTASGGTYCAACSRMRRGILYNVAESLGCNKIALGHHRDDSIETLLLNVFYSGRIQAMPAIYTTDDQRFQVIRPLLECAESDIAEYAQAMDFPILPCNLCGSQEGLKRVEIKELLQQLEQSNPYVRDNLLASLKNVRPTHLLDTQLLQQTQMNQKSHTNTQYVPSMHTKKANKSNDRELNKMTMSIKTQTHQPALVQIEG